MVIFVILVMIQESFSIGDMFLLALVAYLCGLIDGNWKKSTVREPYFFLPKASGRGTINRPKVIKLESKPF